MNIHKLQDEILTLFEKRKVDDGISKLKSLAMVCNTDFSAELKHIDQLWLNYQNALYLKTYTWEQVDKLIYDAGKEISDKMILSLKNSGINDLEKKNKEIPLELKEHNFETNTKNIQSHAELREVLFTDNDNNVKVGLNIKHDKLIVLLIIAVSMVIILKIFGIPLFWTSPKVKEEVVFFLINPLVEAGLMVGIYFKRKWTVWTYFLFSIASVVYLLMGGLIHEALWFIIPIFISLFFIYKINKLD